MARRARGMGFLTGGGRAAGCARARASVCAPSHRARCTPAHRRWIAGNVGLAFTKPWPKRMNHRLPDLPYELVALEPAIDTHTMQLHHAGHHAAYVATLNEAVAEHPQLAGRSATWLLANARAIPNEARQGILTAAGGHGNQRP